MRALRPGAFIVPSFVYERLEALRMQRGANSPTVASSYDLIEQVRLERGRNTDHSYEKIEAVRLQR
jgi:hypothetical protein